MLTWDSTRDYILSSIYNYGHTLTNGYQIGPIKMIWIHFSRVKHTLIMLASWTPNLHWKGFTIFHRGNTWPEGKMAAKLPSIKLREWFEPGSTGSTRAGHERQAFFWDPQLWKLVFNFASLWPADPILVLPHTTCMEKSNPFEKFTTSSTG